MSPTEQNIELEFWSVNFTGKARKQKKQLSQAISSALDLLYGELEKEGPERKNWPHYGKIIGKQDIYHCHLNRNKPCYVAVWKVIDRTVRVMEIRYVGTHENANYKRID
ncbi:MAG: cytotoxic translational repressor of toxin-antitoxin stability system [Deltaproteobacteria bacterium]|nr:cytotoxic translational repressor of toxin-antitoxin stability system [Deltaproteobacteria bacterium]